ncbi:hypothetical protein [Psychrobacter phage vB_PmaS_Y8A]|nr:hypothetical protein [Psychrobacter phage vB_PmaS_Y8A]
MANQVEQQMMFCPHDQRTTLFYRNVKGRNWIMHIILILATGGLWLLAMLFMKSGGSGLWTCSQCGTTQK